MFRIDFRPPRLVNARVLAASLALSTAVAVATTSFVTLSTTTIAALFAVVVAGVLAVRRYYLPSAPSALVIDASGLILPKWAGWAAEVRVPFADVWSVSLSGGLKRGRLTVATRSRFFVYPLDSLKDPQAADRFWPALREEVQRLPDGPELVLGMSRRERVAGKVASRPARFTRGIVIALSLGFALELLLSTHNLRNFSFFGPTPLTMLELGSNAGVLVRAGQWYRLVAANFLHLNVVHLYVNVVAILSLGALLEPLLGPTRLIVIYGASALLGSAASAAFSHALFSVGASTAAFGLLASYAVIEWRFRSELPASLRHSRLWWSVIVGINGSLALLPFVDGWAHLGGAVTGALLTLALVPDLADREASLLARGLGVAMGAVFVLGLGLTAKKVSGPNPSLDDLLRSYDRIAPVTFAEATTLNELAWEVALDARPSQAQLQAALALTQKAIAAAPHSLEIVDTEATLLFRLGDVDKAIALERIVYEDQPSDATIASQLTRFFYAKLRQSPQVKGQADSPLTERLMAKVPTASILAEGVDVTVTLSGPPTTGDLWVVVSEAPNGSEGPREPLGLLRLSLSADRGLKQVVSVDDKVPDSARFDAVAFDPGVARPSLYYPYKTSVSHWPE